MSETHGSRRASITQLLNPVSHSRDAPGGYTSPSPTTGQQLPPQPAHARPHKSEHRGGQYAPPPPPGYHHQQPGMAYPTLRTATWSNGMGSPSQPPPPPLEHYYRDRHDHGHPSPHPPPPPPHAYSYPSPGHGSPYPDHPPPGAPPPPGRRPYEGPAHNGWGGPPDGYPSHSRPSSRTDRPNGERGAEREPSPYAHHPPPPPHAMSYPPQHPANGWQPGERASTRLAARESAQPPAHPGHPPPGNMAIPPGATMQTVMMPVMVVNHPSGQVYYQLPGMPAPYPMGPPPPGMHPMMEHAPPPPPAHAREQPESRDKRREDERGQERAKVGQKRGASGSDGEDEPTPVAQPPKAKKARAKKQVTNEEPPPSNFPSSKRGYTTKKRESTQKAVQHAAKVVNGDGQAKGKTETNGTADSKITPELQFARCMSNRYKSEPFPRCVSCTRRWAGDTCRFQGIRFFLKNKEQELVGISFVESHTKEAPTLSFPTKWNEPLKKDHVTRIKRVVAKALLPVLRIEAEHLNRTGIITRPRESDVRATCDTCMTSIFSASWMCRLCGREACADCFAQVRELTHDQPGASAMDIATLQSRREKHSHANPFFLTCTRRAEHKAEDFSPMSRFCRPELDEAINEMERVLDEPEEEEDELEAEDEELAWVDLQPPQAPAKVNEENTETPETPETPTPATQDTPAHQTRLYDLTRAPFTDEQFRRVWATGIPLVVTGLLERFGIQWTPEYFREKFKNHNCLIYDCQADKEKNVKTTVGEFFGEFGNYEGRDKVWKLKDWPPTTDFKTAFPDLYVDFAQAAPVGSYVRRDGVLNVASHFPTNSVAPDLGPKMYNALASTDKPGSMGSTRLHMDMADAMNIMTWAAPTPDGADGYAVWDIFRAEDADNVRLFLRDKFTIPPQHDPIHAQQYFLDAALRQQLFEKYGVKSHRIYQRPGQAVFIPAGCAHQVCNIADCVKVAIDFVSPENVARCERLTREFREQNQSLVWKEDVLQLRTMMWFAWLSCGRQDKIV